MCQNLVPLVNIKIAGKWMFIPLKMVLIGIDPYPFKLCNSGGDRFWTHRPGRKRETRHCCFAHGHGLNTKHKVPGQAIAKVRNEAHVYSLRHETKQTTRPSCHQLNARTARIVFQYVNCGTCGFASVATDKNNSRCFWSLSPPSDLMDGHRKIN